MTEPTFGMKITLVDGEASPAIYGDLSVIGLVGTAPAADANFFPIDTPVHVFSDDTATTAKLGTTGTIPQALDLINAQLADFQVAARVVIVRVDKEMSGQNEDVDGTITNIIGNLTEKTGINAFLHAGPVLGVIPRLIIVPGYTSQHDAGLTTLTLGTPGSNMTEAPVVVFTGGGTDAGKVLPTAHAVMGTDGDTGKVASLVIDTPGELLSGLITVSFTGGGTEVGKVLPSATGVIAALANPVCAALPGVLDKIIAHAIVDGPATTLQAFTDWRETISSKRIIPLETAVKVGVNGTVVPGSPAVAGIAVRRDYEYNGIPSHSWANQPVAGIVGPNRPIEFSLLDGATEGQVILSENGGVILRGEMGVETAIASAGFVYVGTDNCSDDVLWQFYNVTRMRDFIHIMFLKTLRKYLGKFNIDAQTLEAIKQTMEFALRDLQAGRHILGYKVKFTRDANSPENIRLGKFTVDFAAEEPPVLRFLGINSARYRPALDALLTDLIAQVGAQ